MRVLKCIQSSCHASTGSNHNCRWFLQWCAQKPRFGRLDTTWHARRRLESLGWRLTPWPRLGPPTRRQIPVAGNLLHSTGSRHSRHPAIMRYSYFLYWLPVSTNPTIEERKMGWLHPAHEKKVKWAGCIQPMQKKKYGLDASTPWRREKWTRCNPIARKNSSCKMTIVIKKFSKKRLTYVGRLGDCIVLDSKLIKSLQRILMCKELLDQRRHP